MVIKNICNGVKWLSTIRLKKWKFSSAVLYEKNLNFIALTQRNIYLRPEKNLIFCEKNKFCPKQKCLRIFAIKLKSEFSALKIKVLRSIVSNFMQQKFYPGSIQKTRVYRHVLLLHFFMFCICVRVCQNNALEMDAA